jgi:hypothetical protein
LTTGTVIALGHQVWALTLKGTLYLLWPNLLVRVIRKNLAEGQSHAHKFALVGGFMALVAALCSTRFTMIFGFTALPFAVWLDCSLAGAMVVAGMGLFALAWIGSNASKHLSRGRMLQPNWGESSSDDGQAAIPRFNA